MWHWSFNELCFVCLSRHTSAIHLPIHLEALNTAAELLWEHINQAVQVVEELSWPFLMELTLGLKLVATFWREHGLGESLFQNILIRIFSKSERQKMWIRRWQNGTRHHGSRSGALLGGRFGVITPPEFFRVLHVPSPFPFGLFFAHAIYTPHRYTQM